MWHGDMGAWGWWMMAIGPLVWVGLLLLGAWVISVALRPRSERATPLDLLKESYARGKIPRETFEQAKKDLT